MTDSRDQYGEDVVFGSIVDGSIMEIIDSMVSVIGNQAFQGCSALTTASFPECTSIGASAFQDCYNLTTASFPECTSIGASAFQSCTSLATANFPNVTSIDAYAFRSCAALTTASFPACTSIGGYVFIWCSNVTKIALQKASNFGASAFFGCSNLIELRLDSVQSVPTFGNKMFGGSPIGGYSEVAGRYGSVYVPASLYDAFCSAPNWSAYASFIVPVE